MKKQLLLHLFLGMLFMTAVTACKSKKARLQEQINWVKSLKKGATKDEIQKNKPSGISIDWDKPLSSTKNALKYNTDIIIKSKRQIKNALMRYQLIFVEEKFDRFTVNIEIKK